LKITINRLHFWQLLVASLCGAFWLSCEAPHDNPLDPESKNYSGFKYSLSAFSGQVRSLHTSRNFPSTDTYSVITEAWTNEDIEVDSVTVTYNSKPPVTLDRLDFGLWGAYFESAYFGGGTQMQGVLGEPFIFRFAVTGDGIYTLDSLYMFRVIEGTPVLISPVSDDTVGAHPNLSWEAFAAPYAIRYQASVWQYEDEFEAESWTSELLPDSTEEIQVVDSLVDGNYYWVLFVIDDLLNSSRSREREFVVRNGTPQ
jgi:hypothetical protein